MRVSFSSSITRLRNLAVPVVLAFSLPGSAVAQIVNVAQTPAQPQIQEAAGTR
jgi:hypothetical protein